MSKNFKKLWKSTVDKEEVPRCFTMIRQADESGHSGTGKVLDGVIFPSGKVVICWDPENSRVEFEGGNVNSIAIFDSMEAFEAIHIGQHPSNDTIIQYHY